MSKQSDLTLIVYCSKKPSQEILNDYEAACGQLILICNEVDASSLPAKISVVSQNRVSGKVEALNEAFKQAKGTHILWLDEGETISGIPELQINNFYVAQVSNTQSKTPVHNWQIRLFPNHNSEESLFEGFEIPDIYSTAERLNWQKSNHSLSIQRESSLFPAASIQQEISDENNSAMHTFWQGMMRAEKKDFSGAVGCFKKVLNYHKLAPWNELAALNGLANAYIEIYKLQYAYRTAKKSLEESANQRTPYLTLYQYYNLIGKPDEAYQMLKKYLQIADTASHANWDVYLPKVQATFLMAEISQQQGRHEEAFTHYQQFFDYNKGSVSQAVVEKLLIYSIELEDRKKAIFYFKALFGADLSCILDKDKALHVRQVLSLFAEKNWYGFVNDIYEQLVTHKPEDETLRNGWIRSLMRNNEIQKAQALL